jgi:hypothetical protein
MCKRKENFLKLFISSFSSNVATNYMREYGQLIQTIKNNYTNQAGMVAEACSAVPINEDRVSCREKSLNVL